MCIVTKVIQSHIFEDKTTRSSQPETPKDRIRLLYRNVIHGHTRRLRQHAMGVFFCDGMLQKYWPFRKQKDVTGWYRNIIPITSISLIIALNQFLKNNTKIMGFLSSISFCDLMGFIPTLCWKENDQCGHNISKLSSISNTDMAWYKTGKKF